MKTAKPIPETVPIWKLPRRAFRWFEGRETLLCEVGTVEARFRVQWLAEGSLSYHIRGTPCPHGGVSSEIALYHEFRAAIAK